MFCGVSSLIILSCLICCQHAHSLLPKDFPKLIPENLSRRDAILFGGGSILYGKIVSDTLRKVSARSKLSYPEEHEKRVSLTFERAIMESSQSLYGIQDSSNLISDITSSTNRPFRILEAGVGKDCRTILSGGYEAALQSFFSRYPNQNIELYGLDSVAIQTPVSSEVREYLNEKDDSNFQYSPGNTFNEPRLEKNEMELKSEVNQPARKRILFETIQGDISASLLSTIPDGFFDVVTCCFLLCSVPDQESALREINRIIRPNGGTFGYIEHVAVDKELDYDKKFPLTTDVAAVSSSSSSLLQLQLLEYQQIIFDPLQQVVAHNCHLHRNTEKAIMHEFNSKKYTLVEQERFLVKDMWPVSCQTRGVLLQSL